MISCVIILLALFFTTYEGDKKALRLIELSGLNQDCLSLINPLLLEIVNDHIKSGDGNKLQEAIQIVLLLPKGCWKYSALKPIFAILNNEEVENLREIMNLASYGVNRFYEGKGVQKFQ